jgi:hypothetical protein
MTKSARRVVGLVAAEYTPEILRGALERAGFTVPCASAYDFRGAPTTFATFLETYKPQVVVLDLHPPADLALKDLISFKGLPIAEHVAFVIACSDRRTCSDLPSHAGALPLGVRDVPRVIEAVREALRAREAA